MFKAKITDALNRTAFQHKYDLKPKTGKDDPGANILWTEHIDSGQKTAVFDAAFKPVELRNANLAVILHLYDELNRPVRVWARDNDNENVTLRQKLIYGDDANDGPANPDTTNHLGKLYKHYDETGLLTFIEYDFKGNLLQKTREVISDDDIKAVFNGPPTDWVVPTFRVDWDTAPTLEGSYTTTMTYDALNRVKQMIYPEDQDAKNKVLLPTYNRAGALENVKLLDDVGGSETTYVEHIAYNAKGQRLLISFGNGIMTRYTYDPQSFRLLRLKSEGYTKNGNTYEYNSGTTKQDFKYRYDLAGNIISIRDKAPAAVKGPDDLERTFEYDALYRLLKATGRECDSPGSNPSWDENIRCHDHTAIRTYRREYTYDKMGNILRLKHKDTEDGTNDFTRIFNPDGSGNMPIDYGAQNLLNKVRIGGTDYLFEYDENGNQTKENSNRYFEWDHSDQMRAFYNQAGTSEPSVYTHYLYDAAGNRVKKITRKSSTLYETTVYIDGVFEHIYKYDGSTTADEKNEIHIMDDKSRIAMKWIGYDDGTPEIKYIFEDHLGSSTFVMEGNGSYYNREEYFPFGETSFGSFSKKRYRYCGKEKDEESGLYYYGARYYAAWCCRFISVDPKAGGKPNFTAYHYTSNNPINRIDPSGRQDEKASNNSGGNNTSKNINVDNASGYQWNSGDTGTIGVAQPLSGTSQTTEQMPNTFGNQKEKSQSNNVDVDGTLKNSTQYKIAKPISTDYKIDTVDKTTLQKTPFVEDARNVEVDVSFTFKLKNLNTKISTGNEATISYKGVSATLDSTGKISSVGAEGSLPNSDFKASLSVSKEGADLGFISYEKTIEKINVPAEVWVGDKWYSMKKVTVPGGHPYFKVHETASFMSVLTFERSRQYSGINTKAVSDVKRQGFNIPLSYKNVGVDLKFKTNWSQVK